MSSTIPSTLYIHFPWCMQKCPYCDFNSHPLSHYITGDESHQASLYYEYTNALLADFDIKLTRHGHPEISALFIGGGTPSLVPGAEIQRLLDGIRARANVNPNAEVTLEANPGSVDAQWFETYRSAGVNRLSIGAQSFNPQHLRKLGRIHNNEDIHQAVATARAVGFDNINLDIIYGLGAQTLSDALSDLRQALSLGTKHLSAYQLTIEPNTEYWKRPPAHLPSNDLAHEMQTEIETKLLQKGFEQYEVSAYSRSKSSQCQHNLNYWRFGDYIGIGAGAHGKCTFPSDKQSQSAESLALWRYQNYRHPKTYLSHFQQSPTPSSPTDSCSDRSSKHNRLQSIDTKKDLLPFVQDSQVIQNIEDIRFEYLLNTLRLNNHFLSADEYEQRTGEQFSSLMGWLKQKELIQYFEDNQGDHQATANGGADKRLRLNPAYYPFLNSILERCLPE